MDTMAEQELLKEQDVARKLRMSLATVRRWRLLKTGPPYIKIGASVRYRPEDLEAFVSSKPAVNAVGYD